MLKIRNETEADYGTVEEITRKAFYNQYIPGCVEHYLVHIMRKHEDFIPELAFVLPGYQRKGYGKRLMEHSFKRAADLGYDVIVIFGSPANYVSSGFRCCKKYNVCLENKKFPAAMMVKELKEGALDGRTWFYYDSPVMQIDEEEARQYDDGLEKMEKEHRASQEEFYIMSHAFVE